MTAIGIASTVTITLALVFYSIGIWAERMAKYLKPWHIIMFWAGFTFDVTGTLLMHIMAKGPFNLLEPHTLTGQLALWLMLVHATWATVVVRKNRRH
ncbi:MAG: HsmA family protein [Bacteroidales bacterium]